MGRAQPQYQPGQIVPGTVYRVHRVIGAGGMGTVYDVEDTTVGKRYVLKTLHANLADRDDLAARLLREARALARMHHPSIVEVFTAGTTNDQLRLPYYVMERLNGQSLRQVLSRKQRLEIDQALDIGIDLLDALDHAHELGMIHRDVKPDNIYLHKGVDGTHVAKLLDFGIAKVMASQTQHTGGRFIGTFRYASPEQILGKDVTPRADLYAAGLTLYEMISGRGPFDDFAGEIEIGKAHATVAPPRLSQFVNVPRVLDDLIASSLEKDPARRPKDAFSFASVLRELKQSMRGSRQPQSSPSQDITAKPIATSAPTAVAQPAHQAITPQMAGPTSDKPTHLASPQARDAATEAAPSSGTNPYGPPVLDPPSQRQPGAHATVRISHTLQDGAPAPMTMVPNLSPQPPPVDRNAETNVSAPEPAALARHDTLVLPHAQPPPAAAMSPPIPAHPPDVSTFGAQTTDTPSRSRTSAIAVGVIAFVVVATIGIGGIFLFRHRSQPEQTTVKPPSTPLITATTPIVSITPPPVVSVTPVISVTPPPVVTSVATAVTGLPTVHTAPTTTSTSSTTKRKDPLHVGSGLE